MPVRTDASLSCAEKICSSTILVVVAIYFCCVGILT